MNASCLDSACPSSESSELGRPAEAILHPLPRGAGHSGSSQGEVAAELLPLGGHSDAHLDEPDGESSPDRRRGAQDQGLALGDFGLYLVLEG
eukprot:41070-Heterocapsa_arctica.AAC.1